MIFTLLTTEVVREELRVEVGEELVEVGEQLFVAIDIAEVERFGE